MPPKLKSTRLRQQQDRREIAALEALSSATYTPSPPPELPPSTSLSNQSLSPSPAPPLRNTRTSHSLSPPPAPPLRNTRTSHSLSPPPAPPLRNTRTSHSLSPPPELPPSPSLSNQSLSPPPAPWLRNNTASQSLSPPPAPPLLNAPLVVASSATADDDAPTALSIRCKNPKDGFVVKKRRMVISSKTAHIVRTTGKIKPVYADLHKGPSKSAICSLLTRDIGTVVKTHVPMLASTFYELQHHHKEIVDEYLSNYYNIPRSDLLMWTFVDRISQGRYSDWKHKCNKHFKKQGDALPLEFLHRPDQWEYLLTEFRDKGKQAVNARNQANRKKNPDPINHHSGAKPLSYRAEEYMNKGHVAPHLATAVDVYVLSNHEKVQKMKRKLDEMVQQREEEDSGNVNVQPYSFDDQYNVIKDCLGERRGTQVRGMGGAVQRPAKRRGGPRTVATLEADERVQEAEERARVAEENLKNFMERFQVMEVMVQSLVDHSTSTP